MARPFPRIVKRLLAVLLAVVAVAAAFGVYVGIKVKRPSWKPLVVVAARERLVIRNVRVFTASSAGILEQQDVIIENGRIVAIQPAQNEPASGTIIDGSGKTLLPGLFDAHTHLFSTAAPPWYLALPNAAHNLEAYLYAGVTTVASMGDDLREIRRLRERVDHGEICGPRIVYAGSPITRTGGHPEAAKRAIVPRVLWAGLPEFAVQIDTPEDGRAAVARAAEGGAHFIKVVLDEIPTGAPRLEAAHVAAIVGEAHARGLKVAAHVGTAADAILAAKTGVDLLNHAPNRGATSEADVGVLAAARLPVVPTMIVFERSAEFSERHVALGAMEAAVEAPEILEQLTDPSMAAHDLPPSLRGWFAEIAASRGHRAATVRALHAAGVPLFVGTDSSILGNVAGASIHHEMRMLVRAGVPPIDVLLGATSRPAKFFFDAPEFGSIEPGKAADLLLVDGNPMDDITATERIALVIQGGRIVKRL
jgi:imidazolonepropionase-like amidohydrolase